jgi:hypothetical protein
MSPPSSVLKSKPSKLQETSMKQVAGEASDFCLIHVAFLLCFFFNPENGGSMFSRMSVGFQRTTQRYMPEDRILHNSYEDLKSYAKETECTEKRMGSLRANFYKGASEEDTPSFL